MAKSAIAIPCSFGRERLPQDGLLGRLQRAGAEPLERAVDEERLERVRRAAEDGAEEEEREAEHVDALLAEEAPEERRERHHDDVRDDVPGADPGDLLHRRAERAHHVRERDGDDRRVDRAHQRAERDRHGHEPLVRLRACGSNRFDYRRLRERSGVACHGRRPVCLRATERASGRSLTAPDDAGAGQGSVAGGCDGPPPSSADSRRPEDDHVGERRPHREPQARAPQAAHAPPASALATGARRRVKAPESAGEVKRHAAGCGEVDEPLPRHAVRRRRELPRRAASRARPRRVASPARESAARTGAKARKREHDDARRAHRQAKRPRIGRLGRERPARRHEPEAQRPVEHERREHQQRLDERQRRERGRALSTVAAKAQPPAQSARVDGEVHDEERTEWDNAREREGAAYAQGGRGARLEIGAGDGHGERGTHGSACGIDRGLPRASRPPVASATLGARPARASLALFASLAVVAVPACVCGAGACGGGRWDSKPVAMLAVFSAIGGRVRGHPRGPCRPGALDGPRTCAEGGGLHHAVPEGRARSRRAGGSGFRRHARRRSGRGRRAARAHRRTSRAERRSELWTVARARRLRLGGDPRPGSTSCGRSSERASTLSCAPSSRKS